jgi:hypothetical protein
MELLLIAALIAALRWMAGKMSSEEEEPAPLPPPVPAPRPRRVRRPAPPPAAVADFREGPAVRVAPPPPAPVAAPPRVAPRPVSRFAREFRDPAALRRAVVAREVLGPPLSLRGR